MKTVQYKLKIGGLKTPDGTIPLMALQDVSKLIITGSERVLRLVVEGASIRKGKMPKWIMDSLQYTVTGISIGSTVLEIQAPVLGDTAKEQIQQPDFWKPMPKPDDTALTLMTRSINEAILQDKEGENYDRGVLDAMLGFKPFLHKYAESIELNATDGRDEYIKLNEPDMEKFSHAKKEIPEPKAMIFSGLLNAIEHTEKRFQLTLDDGSKILGTIDPAYIDQEEMRQFWGKKVTLKGTGHFKSSGKLRLIEAQTIKQFEEGEAIFAESQKVQESFSFHEEIKKQQSEKSPLMEIWGKWPGDESIEQLLDALNDNVGDS